MTRWGRHYYGVTFMLSPVDRDELDAFALECGVTRSQLLREIVTGVLWARARRNDGHTTREGRDTQCCYDDDTDC